jgi:hypothetical protein
MTGSDEELARRIAARLDRAAADLSPGIAYRLQQVRARALDGASLAAAPSMSPALATAGAPRLAGFGGTSAAGHWRLWLGIVLIVAAGLGYQQWRDYRLVQAYEDLDAQILSSDLPIAAYLDKGFEAWLAATKPAS